MWFHGWQLQQEGGSCCACRSRWVTVISAWENIPGYFQDLLTLSMLPCKAQSTTFSPPLTTLHPLSFPSTVSYQAGKFSIVPTAVSFGTSIAFFGAVSTPDTLFSFDLWLGICHFSVVSLPAWAQGFLSASPHRGEMVWQDVSSGLPVPINNDTTGVGS